MCRYITHIVHDLLNIVASPVNMVASPVNMVASPANMSAAALYNRPSAFNKAPSLSDMLAAEACTSVDAANMAGDGWVWRDVAHM